MSGSAKKAVINSVYDLLTGDATLMNQVEAVLTTVASGQAYPYVTINDITESSWGTLTYEGRRLTLTIHTYSTHENPEEVIDVQSRLQELLHRRESLSISGWSFEGSRIAADEAVLEENDGDLYHGISPYLIQVDSA